MMKRTFGLCRCTGIATQFHSFWNAAGETSRNNCVSPIVIWIERTYHRRGRQAGLGRLTPIQSEAIMSAPASQAARPQLSGDRAADPDLRARAGASAEHINPLSTYGVRAQALAGRSSPLVFGSHPHHVTAPPPDAAVLWETVSIGMTTIA